MMLLLYAFQNHRFSMFAYAQIKKYRKRVRCKNIQNIQSTCDCFLEDERNLRFFNQFRKILICMNVHGIMIINNKNSSKIERKIV